ncbi:hypothetical protein NP439_14045 [Oceanobacillus jeddahense]|uniref:Uncharacterized protein n=1 Tax=Oceanobacillus jeddahense TaxID=1462527 RepID=A0ABY5JNY5_9BACI|nr:hypothetical protein [Oceanobacillus jeddahense]UUI01182.1 hypothetical protein NP439_14045 [Oceanobacillus jeddahense]
MGINKNVHTTDTAESKAEAEAIAVRRMEALADIYLGTTEIDRYGQYFWLGNSPEAMKAWNKAFNLFKNSRDIFHEILQREYNLNKEHMSSSKVIAARELKLYRPGQDVEEMYADRYQSIQDVLHILDHIMQAEPSGAEALKKWDISIVYNGISPTVRKLNEVAISHDLLVLEHSRITHQISDTVKNLVPERIKEIKPLFEDAK